MSWQQDLTPPIIWSIAGTDSGGGAGLSADTRAAAAFGVHLCPVVAAVTAQNSQAVERVFALPVEQLQAQLDALRPDMRPKVIKTGLLGSVAAVEAVACSVDALRREAPLALVIDPVLRASSGADLADAALIAAYRRWLLPRADLITPNLAEARRLLGDDEAAVPELARRLQNLGAATVCITGGDSASDPRFSLDWLSSPQASGWLALPRLQGRHNHGSGCSFASAAASALARGFVCVDAVVLAKMMTWCAMRDGQAAGLGAGPVQARGGFVFEPQAMPLMGWDESLTARELARWQGVFEAEQCDNEAFGLYAITDSPVRIAALAGHVPQLQLRLKRGPGTDDAGLKQAIAASLVAVEGSSSRLWVNDHWRLAAGASGVHLGQEDVLALSADERQALLDSGLRLGLSSHSLWELARARGLRPAYIACGPVWPTVSKAMPWQSQGLGNLAWWARMAGVPVLAIGGILAPDQARACARAGASGVCLLRALDGEDSPQAFAEAWMQGLWDHSISATEPHPSL